MARMKVLVVLLLVGVCGMDATASEDGMMTTAAAATDGQEEEEEVKIPRVLIIGAGISGISAARRLDDAGITDYLVLEGSDQIGGRLRTAKLGDYTVETGNVWVSGGEGNPIYIYGNLADATLIEPDYEDYVVLSAGEEDVTEAFEAATDMFSPADEYKDNRTREMLRADSMDLNQEAVLKQGGWKAHTKEQYTVELYEVDFESSLAPRFTSTKYPGNAWADEFTDEEFITMEFSKMIRYLAKDSFLTNETAHRLKLNTVVSQIHQNETHVTVVTANGERYEAEQVIVTASLGVLQNRGIEFVPDLPSWKLDSIDGFDFVHYLQIYMQFPSAFWSNNEFIFYSSPQRGHFPIWTNFNKHWPGSNILQCIIFSAEAKRLSTKTESEVTAEAMAVLREMYGDVIPDPTEVIVPTFSTDPLFMGAYANWPPLFDIESHEALKASVGRVHFAGEYTNAKHYGRIVGAYLSGFDLVQEKSDCFKDGGKACADQHLPVHEARGCTYRAALNYDRKARVDDGSCTFPEPPPSSAAVARVSAVLVAVAALTGIQVSF